MKGRAARSLIAALAVFGAAACAPQPEPARVWPVTGTVVSVNAARGEAVIAHEEIPGLMPAMTMPFRLEKPEEVESLQPGDRVTADYVSVPGIGPCLRGVRKLAAEPAQPPQ